MTQVLKQVYKNIDEVGNLGSPITLSKVTGYEQSGHRSIYKKNLFILFIEIVDFTAELIEKVKPFSLVYITSKSFYSRRGLKTS